MAHFLFSHLTLSLQIECKYDIFNLVTGIQCIDFAAGQDFNALTQVCLGELM